MACISLVECVVPVLFTMKSYDESAGFNGVMCLLKRKTM